MRFTLYPIYRGAGPVDDEQFDPTGLPLDITEGVRIEAVSGRFRPGTFDLFREKIGTDLVRVLEGVRYALVHRYEPEPIVQDGEIVGEQQRSQPSETLVRQLAACLRLIRPMRQHALLMRGSIRVEDGSFDVMGFDVPTLHRQEVPAVQKHFALRNQDAENLRTYVPEFLRGMRGAFWKFRMAVQFHESGHFQALDRKARYLLWCSAIESLYTSHYWEHQGSLVATSRIKWLIGEHASIYAPGDISNLLQDPHITVGQIVDDLYEMRNLIAHGDKIPDRFFTDILRQGFNAGTQRCEVLLEASSFIIRSSLIKILRDGLLHVFAGASSAETYFGGQNLTRLALRAAQRAVAPPPALG